MSPSTHQYYPSYKNHLPSSLQKSIVQHLKEILSHVTIHPIRYQKYYLNRIQIQVFHIILYWIHLTNQTTSIKNKDKLGIMSKINAGVRQVLMIQSKSAKSLQQIYLQKRTNKRSLSSNWVIFHYSAGFIYYLSLILLKLFYCHLRKHTCFLWTIHP